MSSYANTLARRISAIELAIEALGEASSDAARLLDLAEAIDLFLAAGTDRREAAGTEGTHD